MVREVANNKQWEIQLVAVENAKHVVDARRWIVAPNNRHHASLNVRRWLAADYAAAAKSTFSSVKRRSAWSWTTYSWVNEKKIEAKPEMYLSSRLISTIVP